MMRFTVSRRRVRERGAVAVMVALLAVVLVGAAALSVDVAHQVQSKQRLFDTMDAAAHAGAYELPDNGAGAAAKATAMAHATDPGSSPTASFYCVVGSTATAPFLVVTSHIPSTCNPGPGPYTALTYPGLRCNASICAIPCFPTAPQNDRCNTISVADEAEVPFGFAPVLGYDKGSTGLVISTACKGSCGSGSVNPMDVAVVADRTGSMSSTDVLAMVTGIKKMLTVMDPSQQYVSLGSIGPAKSSLTSAESATCRSTPYNDSAGALSPTGGAWKWMSLPFYADYLSTSNPSVTNTNSHLVKAIGCLTTASSTGTHLAAPMKAAARYLLGKDTNNLSSLPVRSGTPRKVIIFETDGQPNEQFTGGSTSLENASYPGSTSGSTACTNLGNVATNAKAQNVLIITVAYNLGTTKCQGGGSPTVASVLAAAASPDASGAPSVADTPCASANQRAAENADGDFFFCAASGDDMSDLFVTAIGSAGGGIRLIRLP